MVPAKIPLVAGEPVPETGHVLIMKNSNKKRIKVST
jgi:hypothetical protein